MTADRTEHQTGQSRRKARELSLEPARPPALVPGYKLQQFVGSGAYGEVWSATDLKTGRRVAIKFYTRRSPEDVQRLAREVEKLVVLSADRYVVQLLDVGWDADPPHFVMEFIEHGSVEDRLKRLGTLPVAEAVELFQEIAKGMMHLHSKGIFHCDLKPGNVLLDQDGKPRVADFGQSRLSTDETPALGTLFYMAPEQADTNATPDASWDVYGLGALLFCMITGRPPYYSSEFSKQIESADQVQDRLANYRKTLAAAPAPTQHRNVPGVDRQLAEIIDRSIAADPRKRYSSIQSLLLALRQREITRARRPLMLLGIIGPLMLMGVVSTFGWWASNQAIDKANGAVADKAKDSNIFAAQLAARSAAEQIDEYFRVVTQLAVDERFLAQFDAVIEDVRLKGMRIQLANPRLNAHRLDNVVDPLADPRLKTHELDNVVDPLAETRLEFSNDPLRGLLQPALEKRLQDPNHEFPVAASWFVCDRYGNQIASVFRDDNRTLANNFAFRTYFTGEPSDRALDDEMLATPLQDDTLRTRKIIQRPHLSAVFRSQQSNRWKVAFSAPIIRSGTVEGVVAVTVDLGGLVDFANSTSQYAILVDGRPGENTGAILEHPIYSRIANERPVETQPRVPEELATTLFDLDAAIAAFIYNDPIGDTDIGSRFGYGRDAIVSVEAVTMERAHRVLDLGDASPTDSPTENDQTDSTANQREATGLFVVTVQDYENVLSDVRDLGVELRRLGLMAGGVLLLVALSIAYFVNLTLKESRQRLTRSFTRADESSRPTAPATIREANHEPETDLTAHSDREPD